MKYIHFSEFIAVKQVHHIELFLFMLLVLPGCKKENIKPNLEFNESSFGCSSFIVYKTNDNNDATIAVLGDRQAINLSMTEQTFDLGNINENDLTVELRRFSQNANKFYCNDVPSEAGETLSLWKGIEGTLMIKITQDSIATNPKGQPEYRINVIIKDIELENQNGKIVGIPYLEFKEVYVGWLPG